MDTLSVQSRTRIEFVDITDQIKRLVAKNGVREGSALIFVPHTTAGITINEAADPSVVVDINEALSKLVPHRGSYRHSEGNSDAHIKSSLVGSSVHVIVSAGAVVLGTWQGIFFCEFDGPRSRKVHVEIVGKPSPG